MSKKNYSVLECFKHRVDLKKYKDDGLLLFAVQLRYGIEDIDTLASESLTEGGDDKKTDLLYIDKERGIALIAQAYFSRSEKHKSAKANKASDLNTAITWLLNAPLEKIPPDLKSHASELRQVITDREINSLQIWYVHNLQESKNVKNELEIVEHTTKSALKTNFKGSNITDIQAIEVGIRTLEEWYKSLSIPILITDEFILDIPGGYPVSGDDWKAFITAIKGEWLYEQFKIHKTKLFSANVREYLGSQDKDDNINNGIKQSANDEPQNFWVYNNGITALVNDFQAVSETQLKINGISIVNGAQTTGALGSLKDKPSSKLFIPIRFIKSKEKNIIYSIVKYNNSQNKVAAPDFRSSDPIQTRLTNEFKTLNRIKYLARRGGYEDLISRDPNTLPSVTAGQALAAFHQNPGIAYHKKTKIWDSDTLYSKYFNDHTTAKHVFFAYSLLRAIEKRKMILKDKKKRKNIIQVEENELEYFRKRGAIFLLVAGVSKCIEVILNKPVPNLFNLKFKHNDTIDKAIEIWEPIIDVLSSFTNSLGKGLADGFKNEAAVGEAITEFQSLGASVKRSNQKIFDKFSSEIIQS